MDPVYISAIAALAGSIVGSGTSLLSAWLIQHRQEKERHISQDRSRRRALQAIHRRGVEAVCRRAHARKDRGVEIG
jgi:hypothetical protein